MVANAITPEPIPPHLVEPVAVPASGRRYRGLSAEEFTPKGLLRAYTESERGPIVYDEVR